jgi:hypothetical protein
MVMTSLFGIGLGMGVIACAACRTPNQAINVADTKRSRRMKFLHKKVDEPIANSCNFQG